MKGLRKDMRIEYLEAAVSDLDNIMDYYFDQFGIESAMKVYGQIKGSISHLAEYTNLGVPSKDQLLRRLGYRELYSGRFVAVYRREDEIIYIYHIADTQRDYPNLFKEGKKSKTNMSDM